jgi:serine/threonine protein phosphatase PrpC
LNFFKKLVEKISGPAKAPGEGKVDVETIPLPRGIETAPLSVEQLQAVTKTQVDLHPAQLVMGTGTTVGRQRDHNEDTIIAVNGILVDEKREQLFGIFVVADGMGGYEYGEVASSVASRTFCEYVMGKLYSPLMGAGNQSMDDSILEVMEDAVKAANRAVVANAPGAGTTLTAALIMGEQVTIAHVGDSRGYFIFPDGRMQQLTQDHSLVQRLQDLGQLTREEALTHPQRNVLYRALGQAEPFRPDINMFQFPHHGSLLLASDGLWGTVLDGEIFRIVKSSENPSIACHLLCEAANEAGGPDNSSVILVEYLS